MSGQISHKTSITIFDINFLTYLGERIIQKMSGEPLFAPQNKMRVKWKRFTAWMCIVEVSFSWRFPVDASVLHNKITDYQSVEGEETLIEQNTLSFMSYDATGRLTH